MKQLSAGLLALALAIPALVPAAAQNIGLIRPVARPAALTATAPATAQGDAVAEALAAEAAVVPTPLIPPAPQVPDAAALAAPAEITIGPETNLPLPRYVSLKSDDANVRRGPSLSHRIDWVFTREDMPLMITAEYGHWRRVVDREGLGGWVHYALLSGVRTVIVDSDLEPLYARPDTASAQNALLEAGVIARIDECSLDWCRVSAGGYRGWVPKTALWGIGTDEILD